MEQYNTYCITNDNYNKYNVALNRIFANNEEQALNIYINDRKEMKDFALTNTDLAYDGYIYKYIIGKDEKEILKAWNIPSIIHYVRAKPWKVRTKHTNVQFHEDWWRYAQMTEEYKNIVTYYRGVK